jgi:putative resolvase
MLVPFCATAPHSRNLEALLTLKQACELAGVAPITLRRWTNEGKLQCLRTIGGSRRFRSSDILAAFGQQPDETTISDDGSSRGNHVIPIAVVIRVSSKGQACGDGSSYELQEQRLRDFVKEHFKGQRVELTFYKRVASGLNLENEVFLSLVNDVLAGKFNGGFVVAENPNRVARFAVSLFKHLCSLGNATLLYSLSDEDSKSDHETLVEDVLSILQHFTARVTGQKAKKILAVKVDPDTVQRVLVLRHSGHSYLSVAQILERQGIKSECGKPITRNVVWRIVKENAKLLDKLKLDPDLSCCSARQSWERFIAQRLKKADASCTLPLKTVLASYREFCGEHGWPVLTESRALNAILLTKLTVQKAFDHTHTRIYRGLRLLATDKVSNNEQLPGGEYQHEHT